MPKRSDNVEKLAERLATRALASEDDQFMLDAFKVLSGHKIGLVRAKKGQSDDAEEGTTMDALTKRIKAAEQGDA